MEPFWGQLIALPPPLRTAWPDDERAVSLHHDVALRQDVSLLAGVHNVAFLQHFEGERSIALALQLHLNATERNPLSSGGRRASSHMKFAHQLHSAEAPHPQSTDDVEIFQGHTGEEICLGLQSGQGRSNNIIQFYLIL